MQNPTRGRICKYSGADSRDIAGSEVGFRVGNQFLVIVRFPDAVSETLAHSKTDTNCSTDNQETNQDLDDDAVPLAEVAQAVALPTAHLLLLCLLFPVARTGPHLAVGASSCALG